MMYSDGLAARLLVKNLIKELKEKGVISGELAKRIYDDSINQLSSGLANIASQSEASSVPDQPDEPSPELEDLEFEVDNSDIWKNYIEAALDILRDDPNYKD
jgi:polyhydroxyalkanoate synthesis regulator phasin